MAANAISAVFSSLQYNEIAAKHAHKVFSFTNLKENNEIYLKLTKNNQPA